jgi:hypothetical protein
MRKELHKWTSPHVHRRALERDTQGLLQGVGRAGCGCTSRRGTYIVGSVTERAEAEGNGDDGNDPVVLCEDGHVGRRDAPKVPERARVRSLQVVVRPCLWTEL